MGGGTIWNSKSTENVMSNGIILNVEAIKGIGR